MQHIERGHRLPGRAVRGRVGGGGGLYPEAAGTRPAGTADGERMSETPVARQSPQVVVVVVVSVDRAVQQASGLQHVLGTGTDKTAAAVVPVQIAGGAFRADRVQTHAPKRHEAVVHVARVAVRVQPDVREPHVIGVPVPAWARWSAHVQQVQGEAVWAEEPVPVAGRAGHVQEHQGLERGGQNSDRGQFTDESHRSVHSAQFVVLVHGQHLRFPKPYIRRRGTGGPRGR